MFSGDAPGRDILRKQGKSAYTVVFVAVHKEKIDYVKEFLQKLLMQPYAITISSFAIFNAVHLIGSSIGGWKEAVGFNVKSGLLNREGEVNLSLYTEGSDASLAIISNGTCTHIKSFILDLSKPLKMFVDDVSEHLTNTLPEIELSGYNNLFLSGDVSSLPELSEALIERFSINPVEIKLLDTLGGTDVKGIAPSAGAVFAGLGIGSFRLNLLPHRMEYEIKKTAVLSMKILLGLILILTLGIFIAGAVKQKMLLTKIDDALKENEPTIRVLEKLTSDINEFGKQREFIENVKEEEFTLEMLAALTEILPKDTWITNFDYKGFKYKDGKILERELIISGLSDSSSNLIALLEDSPFFSRVGFVGPIRKRMTKEGFKLKALVVNPENSSIIRASSNSVEASTDVIKGSLESNEKEKNEAAD